MAMPACSLAPGPHLLDFQRVAEYFGNTNEPTRGRSPPKRPGYGARRTGQAEGLLKEQKRKCMTRDAFTPARELWLSHHPDRRNCDDNRNELKEDPHPHKLLR